ncbi:NACHT, LRR and PYD domains-containing protein 12 isoform X3 [Silurus asotus]|uniref:NACHT, LRR and PYD domains-containing protein 12 isoform X3 n=1 Tax=Silurus asotus TaxID=30991 RepID=A0AAD5FMS0_SILAS|nr:NACHT, LRR and PYD domains-containing protein 12 isoform X3 [Silurus asotus]
MDLYSSFYPTKVGKVALHISLLSGESLSLAASGGEFGSCARFIRLLTRELELVTADLHHLSPAPESTDPPQCFPESSVLHQIIPESSAPSQDLQGITTLLLALLQALQDGTASPQDLQEISDLLQVMQDGFAPPPGLQEILTLLQDLHLISSHLKAPSMAARRLTSGLLSGLDITPLQISLVGVNLPLITAEGIIGFLVSAVKAAQPLDSAAGTAWSLSYTGDVFPPPTSAMSYAPFRTSAGSMVSSRVFEWGIVQFLRSAWAVAPPQVLPGLLRICGPPNVCGFGASGAAPQGGDLEHKVISLLQNELKRYKKLLSPDYPACSEREVEDVEDQSSVIEEVLKITLHFLKNMKHTDLANTLQNKLVFVYQRKLKSNLREKCERITEGISQHGSSALLNEIYTDLYITEGWSGDINNEHEVRQIETVTWRPTTQETSIKCNDLFKDKSIRSVLTKGVAGIGKTVSVQKFILDWAEGKANQDVTFMFPLPFRELNLMKQNHLSLMNLLHHFFSEIKDLRLIDCERNKVVLIFDGLDECRLPLNFQNNERLCDVTKSSSLDVLLTNLIKGNLLPSALLWITSRPGAANQIPPECVGQVTEVRGFSDPQKEKYFRKRISDQSLTNKIITHMKSSRSLYIMCHIPVFCWISATVLERMLGEAESGEIPKTLTQMFTNFLIFQIKHKHQKYHQICDPDPQQTRESIMALGKLAFQQLEKGNLIFYEEDLRECGIDVGEASVYSGVCTQIFREEFGLHLGKVFSFVHLSVQEFLAALYTFLSFINKNIQKQQTNNLSDLFTKSNMSDFLRCAVDKTLQSENGHLDLFLRFLLGLSLESNQTLLQDLLPQTGSSSHSKQETGEYIKEKIRENPSPEKSINLFHCLNELNDHSLVQEVQRYLNSSNSRCLSGVRLSPAQWSALVFVLLNSEENLDEFNLSKYDRSDECLLRLLPVVKASRKVV